MKNFSMRRGLLLLPILSLAGLGGCCCSNPAPTGPKTILASDDAAIQDALPKPVTVSGAVSSIDVGDDVISVHFVGADKSGFYAVVLARGRDAMEQAFGQGLKNLQNKQINVTGQVTLYRGKPEIILSKPDQVVVVGPAPQS